MSIQLPQLPSQIVTGPRGPSRPRRRRLSQWSAGATLQASGQIDQTQTYSTITANYAMKYVDCATGGPKMTYDVRWNVMSVSTNTSTRLITASARVMGSNPSQLGNQFFALPVNLRGIGGP